jgi:Family of unknown function (DUF6252)
MRPPRAVLPALAACLVLAVSCDQFKSPTSPIGLSTGASMSARIDGVGWGSTTVAVTFASGRLSLVGVHGDSNLSFTVAATQSGVYSVTAPGNSATFSTDNGGAKARWIANSTGAGTGAGSVTISYWSPAGAAGTFDFTELVASPDTPATGVRQVTQGQFVVDF